VEKLSLRGFLAVGALAAGLFVGASAEAATPPRVLAVEFANDVNPVTQAFATDAIERANAEGFSAIVILLDTPGGLLSSMRKIYQAELASRIPVIVYVSPRGARAASAGVWIGQAADVLAMAPETNIGSSTPIGAGGEEIGGDARRKAINDAAASLRALAKSHGRNVRWADAAVRRAANLTADEALAQNVIDVTAPSLPALLRKIDGTRVSRGLVLRTAGAQVERAELSGWKRILDTIIDPNIIVLLMSLGTLGIVVELWNPGLVFPGAVGGISLILGLYGLQVLPVSWAGILLMLLAAGFFGAELFIVSHGALALAGAITFVFGALILFDPAGENYQVSLQVALAIAGTVGLFFTFALAKAVEARRRPVAVGIHQLVGDRGTVRRGGFVLVQGELWRARSLAGRPLEAGELVEVEHVEDGLVLAVRPTDESGGPAA